MAELVIACQCEDWCDCHPRTNVGGFGCVDISVVQDCNQTATGEDLLCDGCREEHAYWASQQSEIAKRVEG